MRADDFLEERGIEFENVKHEPVETCGEAAEVRGIDASKIVKSLVIEKNGEYYHVCIPGNRTLSEKKFGRAGDPGSGSPSQKSTTSSIRMVDPEKSKELTGQESGTIHPFSTGLPHVIDERLLEKDKLSHTVGNPREGVVYSPEDFRQGLESLDCDMEFSDVVVTTDADIQQLTDYVDEESARFLVESGHRSKFLELVDEYEPGKLVNAVKKLDRQETEFSAGDVSELVERAKGDTHMLKLAEEFAETGELPREEDFDLDEVVAQVIEENPEAVEDYRDGRDSAINYLLGQVMQETGGRADGGRSRKLILEELE
ncbi:MAG: YbaK/EbsC family protein [Candidatus Nanohaloarchaea archaeon]